MNYPVLKNTVLQNTDRFFQFTIFEFIIKPSPDFATEHCLYCTLVYEAKRLLGLNYEQLEAISTH